MKVQIKKKKRSYPELPISKGAIKWLVFALAISAAWHIPHTPIWAIAATAILGGRAVWLLMKEQAFPPAYLRIILALGSVVGILITYRSFLGRDPGMTTLILLSTLKLMEMRTRRDFMIVVFLCYFLVFGNFLYDQSIEDLAFTLTAFILITAALLRLNHPEPEVKPETSDAAAAAGKGKPKPAKVSSILKLSFRLFLFALPFTVILFFLFPRTSVPLWNLSQDSMARYRSGFNDVMRPGNIADLAQSNLPAFQVEFPGDDMPEMKDLYFRGLILWFTSGDRWYQGILPARYRRPQAMTGEGVIQQITIQPHNHRWLFGLDRVVVQPSYTGTLPGGIFQTPRPVRSHFRYRVMSRLDALAEEEISETLERWSLQLPADRCARIKLLGKEWRENAGSNREIIETARAYFQDNGFVYSLSPGMMDYEEPFEDFLFNKRQGFCEHFAGAFAMLMRAAKVPARVVAGYQGGSFNEVGNYLQVRQSDAHAWTEVWLEDGGWTRIDPTSWVAPNRIIYGAEVNRSLANMTLTNEADQEEALRRALGGNFFKRIFRFFKEHWDNINYKWDVWIISYDRFRQRDFFKGLGFEQTGRLGLLGALVIIIPTLFFLLSYLLKRQALSSDPLLKLYQVFCSKMKKAGVQRLRWEGPLHYQHRVLKKLPKKAGVIGKFNDLFIHMRYGKLPVTKPRLKELKRHLRKL